MAVLFFFLRNVLLEVEVKMEINEKSVFYVPDYYHIEEYPLHLFLDPEMPNWIITDKKGSQIMDDIKNWFFIYFHFNFYLQ